MKAFLTNSIKKKSIIALFVIVLAISVRKTYIKIENLILKPAGTEVSIEEFKEDIGKIAFNEKLYGYGTLYDPVEINSWDVLGYNFEKANAEDKVLLLGLSRFMFKNAPNEESKGEIKVLVRTFFYIKAHKLPINISGIMMDYIRIRAGEAILYITMEELEALYSEVYIEGIPLKKQVDLLADIIVEKTGYHRNGHKFWISKPKE